MNLLKHLEIIIPHLTKETVIEKVYPNVAQGYIYL